MKKIVLFLLATIALSACSSSKNDVSPGSDQVDSEFSLDISKLQSLNSSVTADTSDSILDFGITTNSSQSLSKIITLKNSSSVTVPFTLGTLTDGVGFSLRLNRCTGSVVPAKGSCQITIQFSARGLYTSTPSDYLSIAAGADSLSIQLKAEITNQPNPNTLEPSLVYSLSTTATGKVLTVKNNGPGDASNISPTIPDGYAVQLNRCGGTLKSTKSCAITLIFKNYRTSPQPTAGAISVVAKGSSENLPAASIDIVTGQVTIATTTPVITLARPPAGSIILLVQSNGSANAKILCGPEGSGFDSCSYTGDEYNRSIIDTGGVIKL